MRQNAEAAADQELEGEEMEEPYLSEVEDWIVTSLHDGGHHFALPISDILDRFEGLMSEARIRQAIVALTQYAAEATAPNIRLADGEQTVMLVEMAQCVAFRFRARLLRTVAALAVGKG